MMAHAVPFLRHLHVDQLIELKRNLLVSLQSSFSLCWARQRCLLLISVLTLDTPKQTLEPFLQRTQSHFAFSFTNYTFLKTCFRGYKQHHFPLHQHKAVFSITKVSSRQRANCPLHLPPSLGSPQIPRPSQHRHVAVILRDPRHRSRLLFRSNLSLSNSASHCATRAPQPALTVPQDVVPINSCTTHTEVGILFCL